MSKDFKEELIEETVEKAEKPTSKPKEKAEKPTSKPKEKAEKPTSKPKEKAIEKEETVKFFIPHVEGEEDEIFVSINNRNFKIKTGVEVDLPLCVAEVIRNSNRQVLEARQKREKFKNQEIASL